MFCIKNVIIKVCSEILLSLTKISKTSIQMNLLISSNSFSLMEKKEKKNIIKMAKLREEIKTGSR